MLSFISFGATYTQDTAEREDCFFERRCKGDGKVLSTDVFPRQVQIGDSECWRHGHGCCEWIVVIVDRAPVIDPVIISPNDDAISPVASSFVLYHSSCSVVFYVCRSLRHPS